MCGQGADELFRPLASHVKLYVFVCPGEGFVPVFCLLMAVFEIQSWNLWGEGGKSLLKVFAGAVVFISVQVVEASVGSHQSYRALCGFWVLCCFKNIEK